MLTLRICSGSITEATPSQARSSVAGPCLSTTPTTPKKCGYWDEATSLGSVTRPPFEAAPCSRPSTYAARSDVPRLIHESGRRDHRIVFERRSTVALEYDDDIHIRLPAPACARCSRDHAGNVGGDRHSIVSRS